MNKLLLSSIIIASIVLTACESDTKTSVIEDQATEVTRDWNPVSPTIKE